MGKLKNHSKRPVPPETSTFRLREDIWRRLAGYAFDKKTDLTGAVTEALDSFLPPLKGKRKTPKGSTAPASDQPLNANMKALGIIGVGTSFRTDDLTEALGTTSAVTLAMTDFRTWLGQHDHREALRHRLLNKDRTTHIYIIQQDRSETKPDSDTISCLKMISPPPERPLKGDMFAELSRLKAMTSYRPQKIQIIKNCSLGFYFGQDKRRPVKSGNCARNAFPFRLPPANPGRLLPARFSHAVSGSQSKEPRPHQMVARSETPTRKTHPQALKHRRAPLSSSSIFAASVIGAMGIGDHMS